MLTLYHSAMGAHSLAALIYLEEKDIPYRAEAVDILAFEDPSPDPGGRGGGGQLPVLVDDKTRISGATAITRYIEALSPAGGMQPESPRERARMAGWLRFVDECLSELFHELGRDASAHRPAAGRQPAFRSELKSYLHDIEVALARHHWLAGTTYSLADIHAFPFVATLTGSLPLDDYSRDLPHIWAWLGRIMDRRAVHATLARLDGDPADASATALH